MYYSRVSEGDSELEVTWLRAGGGDDEVTGAGGA
jgi:hypothetical protein